MNTDPFQRINPCGYPGLGVTQLREYGSTMTVTQAAEALLPHLLHHLGYSGYNVMRSEGLADLQSAWQIEDHSYPRAAVAGNRAGIA